MTEKKISKQQASLPTVFSEERLTTIVQRAKSNKAITLWELAQAMATDENYNAVLPQLWEIFDLNSEKTNKLPLREINVNTVEGRVAIWNFLLARWAAISEYEKFYFKELPQHPRLPLYYYEGSSLRRVEDGEKRKEDHFVKLDDLAGYLIDIEYKYDLKTIPWPMHLFSNLYPDEKIKREEGILGQDILDKYRVKPFQLLDCIRKERFTEYACDGYKAKLQPYSQASLQPIKIRNGYGERTTPMYNGEFNPNYSKEVAYVEDLLDHIPVLVFKRSEVEETLKEYGLYQQEEKHVRDILDEKSPPELTDVKKRKDSEECLENPAIIQLIKESNQERRVIWKAIIKDARLHEVSLSNSKPSDLQDTVITTLANPEYSFKKVKKKHFEDLTLFIDTIESSQPKRYFREMLLQQLIKEQTPEKDITKREIRNLLEKIKKKSKKSTAPVTAPLQN